MSDKLYWGLPGGSVKNDETIHMTLNRIAKNINKDIVIGDVEPISKITIIFNYKDKTIQHEGLAFMVRARNNIDFSNVPGDFIEVDEEELNYINR